MTAIQVESGRIFLLINFINKIYTATRKITGLHKSMKISVYVINTVYNFVLQSMNFNFLQNEIIKNRIKRMFKW